MHGAALPTSEPGGLFERLSERQPERMTVQLAHLFYPAKKTRLYLCLSGMFAEIQMCFQSTSLIELGPHSYLCELGSRLIFRFNVWKWTALLLFPPCGSCTFAIRAKSKSHFVVFVLALEFYLHPRKRTRSEFCRVICRTTCPVVKFSAFVAAQVEGRFFVIEIYYGVFFLF